MEPTQHCIRLNRIKTKISDGNGFPSKGPKMTAAELNEPSEHVLVVPTLLFRELGYFQGFNASVDRYIDTLLDPAHTSFRPRNEVEEDPSFKQLIPYCIFRHAGQVFYYTRGKKGGEGR